MLLRKQKKINLDTFLSNRGIILNNYNLGENSIFLRKVLKAKNHKKILSFNLPYSSVDNTPIRSNKIINSLISIENDSNIFDNNKTINRSIYKKSYFLNSNLKDKSNTKDIINSNNNINNGRNSIISNRLFNTNMKLKRNKFGFMQNMNQSSENILNRFLRNKNTNNKTNKKPTENKIKHLDILFSPNKQSKQPTIIHNNKKENKIPIYSKKNKFSKFKTNITFGNKSISRNYKKKFHTQNNSKSKSKNININNSITHSIDFSIIDKINLKDNFNNINNITLSKTSDNFFILNKKNKKSKNSFERNINNSINSINNSKNIKFMNHFIKYCYLYFMQIIKKFFNNIKKIKNEKIEEKISNIKNNNFNIFNDFNKDDFDKETIKNKTSDNFFDALNDNSFSFFSECKKNSIYNRKRRINNQNYQEKNLLQILNTTTIGNFDKIINFDKKRNCFDNENDKNNNIVQSPFFCREINQTNKDNFSLENRKIILTKNEMKEKSGFANNNILGFVKINNEINPFNIQENNINFLDQDIKNTISHNKVLIFQESQQNTDDILSFRKNNNPENINTVKINNFEIIKINNITSEDGKISIDIKYTKSNIFQYSLNKNHYNNLNINKFFFEFINDKIRIIKISARLKDAKLIKEKEEIIQQNNNYNNYNFLLNNLSIIKEEESPMTKTFKKKENYYPISNNSKLNSKISVEKLIDGEKEINEEDIDKILMDSLSDYNNNYHKLKKLKNWQSQEIMVVSNFNSAMRNRRYRKENAKLLIEGILCLIKFFGNLCFNIRKDTYIKLKWNWKMNRFINYLISFCIKKNK